MRREPVSSISVVPVKAMQRLGCVSEGSGVNQRSHTQYSRARKDVIQAPRESK